MLRGEVQTIWQLGALKSSTNWSSGCGLLSGAVMLSIRLFLLLRSGWLISTSSAGKLQGWQELIGSSHPALLGAM